MTGALDTRAKAVAGRLITQYGRAITFTAAPSPGDYDPTTGAVTDTPATYQWFGVVSTYDEAMGMRSTAKSGKQVLIVPVVNGDGTAATFTPDVGWRASVHGQDVVVDAVSPIGPGEVVVAWVLEVRG